MQMVGLIISLFIRGTFIIGVYLEIILGFHRVIGGSATTLRMGLNILPGTLFGFEVHSPAILVVA